MADLDDVLTTLTNLVAQAVYPNGTGQPSVSGADIRVFPGWPSQASLDADLLAGKSQVSIYPLDMERNTTRFPRDDWQQSAVNAPTFTLTINGQQITVAGAVPAPFYAQNVMVRTNGVEYAYAVQANDTPTTIATALAGLIPGASNVGAVLTLTGKVQAARVGAGGTIIREIRRQERVFQITCWCDTPAKRKAIGSAIDVLLSITQFLSMPDGYGARMVYKSSQMTDMMQKSKVYRRDLNYTVEFATTQTATATQVTQLKTTVNIQPNGATAPVATINVTA